MAIFKRKQGSGFFLVLLTFTLFGAIAWWAFSFRGREVTIALFERQIVHRVLPASLPSDYPPVQAKQAVAAMAAFYEAARRGEVSDEGVVSVSRRLQETLGDERLTPDEIVGLLKLVRQYQGDRTTQR